MIYGIQILFQNDKSSIVIINKTKLGKSTWISWNGDWQYVPILKKFIIYSAKIAQYELKHVNIGNIVHIFIAEDGFYSHNSKKKQ